MVQKHKLRSSPVGDGKNSILLTPNVRGAVGLFKLFSKCQLQFRRRSDMNCYGIGRLDKSIILRAARDDIDGQTAQAARQKSQRNTR